MKWIAIIGGIIVTVVLVVLGYVYYGISQTEQRMSANYTSIKESTIVVDTSLAALERGKHQASIRGCVECHGSNFAGKTIIDSPETGALIGANISGGKGSPVATYTMKDWENTIRYGVKPNGSPVIFMPSDEFTGISERDLADLISYLVSVEPVDKDPGKTAVSPIFKFIAHMDRNVKLIPAELVKTETKVPEHVEPERTVEYGKYLAVTCTGCHGAGFKGGKIPGVPPDWPEAPNLTKTGVLSKIDNEYFKSILRTGVASDGRNLNPMYMPYPVFKEFNDLEMDAIYLYLASLN